MANEQQLTPHGANSARTATVVGPSLVLQATRMTVAHDLVVHGTIDGNVVAGGRVVVAEGGVVTGHIDAHSVSIAGVVHGGANVKDSLQIDESGELYGDVSTKRIFVAPGSVGNFQLTMRSSDPSRAAVSLTESRRAYEAALRIASEATGKDTPASEGYVQWSQKQGGVTSDKATSKDDASGQSTKTRAEITIDPERRSGERSAFTTEGAVERMAWSKSVGDEHKGANSDHFGLTRDEIESLAGDDRGPQSS